MSEGTWWQAWACALLGVLVLGVLALAAAARELRALRRPSVRPAARPGPVPGPGRDPGARLRARLGQFQAERFAPPMRGPTATRQKGTEDDGAA